jgi:hypothetical protein
MARKTSIPKFGIDKGQYGVLVLGRRFMRELTVMQVKSLHATTAAWRAKSALPLAFVSPGPAGEDDDSSAGECFYAGILIGAAKDNQKDAWSGKKYPIEIDKALLDITALQQIPSGYWDALKLKYALDIDLDEADADWGPATGLFLAPAGWAVATLYLGTSDSEYLLTTSSEDTCAGKRVNERMLSEIANSNQPLQLLGEYC